MGNDEHARRDKTVRPRPIVWKLTAIFLTQDLTLFSCPNSLFNNTGIVFNKEYGAFFLSEKTRLLPVLVRKGVELV